MKSRFFLFFQHAYDSKITLRIFLIVFIILVLPIFSVSLSLFGSKVIKSDMIIQDEYKKEANKAIADMENAIFEQEQALLALSHDPKIKKYSYENDTRYLQSIKQIQQEITLIKEQHPHIDDIKIFINDNLYIISSTYAYHLGKDSIKAKTMYEKYVQMMKDNYMAGTDGITGTGIIYDFMQPIGFVSSSLNIPSLMQTIKRNTIMEDSLFCIFYKSNLLALKNNAYEVNRSDLQSTYTNRKNVIEINNKLYNIVWSESSNSNLTYGWTYPTQKSFYSILKIMVPILIISILSAFLLSSIFSYLICSPIQNIVYTLSKLDEPHINPSNSDTNNKMIDEISIIKNTVLQAQIDKELLKKELEHQQLNLEYAQSVALQYQMNPHFLFNSLEAINWKSILLLNGSNEISDMITLLAKLLRKSLDTSSDKVFLDSEIEHISLYLQVFNIIYKNKISVVWDISEHVKTCKTMQFLLQPIIENSIIHGFKPISRQPKLKIKAYCSRQDLFVVICDNGCGITPSTLEQIQDNLNSTIAYKNNHLGLCNVNWRIKLKYGQGYGISIISKYSVGTIVKLHLPLEE